MPFKTLQLQPGVNNIETPTLNKTQLAFSNLIRFYGSMVQKIGGWLRLTSTTFTGVCRGLHGWSSITGASYIAAGTTTHLYVYTDATSGLASIGGAPLSPFTPVTTNPVPSLSTFIGSTLVNVVDAGYSPALGQLVNIVVPTSVGGILLSGNYVVVARLSGTSYQIQAATPATASASNTGFVPFFQTFTIGTNEVQVSLTENGLTNGQKFNVAVSTTVGGITLFGEYPVSLVNNADFNIFPPGAVATSLATAFENGGNMQITYGAPPGFSGPGRLPVATAQWSLDNFGQDLIASPTNGPIWFWQPPSGPLTLVSPFAPVYNIAVFVMPQIQIIVALGASVGEQQQPLLVAWCDAGDFTDWTPTATNQAGSYQISTGTTLVGGLGVGLGALLWTDIDVWSMTYTGAEFVFGFNRIAANCGLIAQRAAGVGATTVAWLSPQGFFAMPLGGGVTPLECPVWEFFFNNVDTANLGEIHCAANPQYHELCWHFPIAPTSPIYSASAPYAYVKWNYVENNCWDFGQSTQYQRTAWTERSALGNPVGADIAGLLQQHEIGFDADGAAMVGGWQTGYFDLAEGEQYPFCDLIIPDFTLDWNASPPVLTLNVLATNYPFTLPTGAPQTIGPFTINAASGQPGFVPLRARARQLALSVSWADLGTFNRIGAIRFRVAPDGRV